MQFDPEAHCYMHNGKELKPVTSWVKQYEPYFLSEFIADKCAKKEGCTKEDILAKWSLKGKIATDLGSAVHEAIEYYVKHGEVIANPILSGIVEQFAEEFKGKKLHSEVIVYDDEYAGTIDLIEVVDKGKVKIHDYKTNEDLYKKRGKLLEPFKDLDNTPLNRYRLQLSKYKELLEGMKDVEVIELNIWHITDKIERIKLEPIKLNKQ